MFRLLIAGHKVVTVIVISLFLVACGGGGSSDKSSDNNMLSNDTKFMYVQRNVTQDVQFNAERLKLSKSGRDSSPFDLASPYEFQLGAQLMSRSSLDANGVNTEVLAHYFNSNDYDVKDLNISPDGQFLIFAAHGPHDNSTDYTWNIYEYSFIDQTIRRIIKDDLLANAGQDTNPAYALDGSIVFSSDRAAGNPDSPVDNVVNQYQSDNCYKVGPNEKPSLLHSMTKNGENILQLTYGKNHDTKPTTLKDGRIAFVRWSRTYELLQGCPVAGAATQATDMFNEQYPDGLDLPAKWPLAALCAAAQSTPLGKVLASNHYTILRITADGKELHQLYKTVTLTGSDESFIGIDHIVQTENGQLAALLKHQYNQFLGGNIVELQSPEAITSNQVFGNIAPRSLFSGDVDLYPNQHSVNGWYSAVWPYRDGTGRLLVSWSQCSTINNGVNAFCQSNDEAGEVNGQYGIWVLDQKTDSRLPIVRARKNTVYSDLAISQPNSGLDFPFEPYNKNYVDNLDTNRVICSDPGVVVPPLGTTYASSVASMSASSYASSTPEVITYSSANSIPVVVTYSSANSVPVVITHSSTNSTPVIVVNSSVSSTPVVVSNSSVSSTPDAMSSSSETAISTASSTVAASSTAPINKIATANAGLNQSGDVGNTFILDGSSSHDPDGSSLTYKWMLLSSPLDSNVSFLNWTQVNPSLIPDKQGDYVVQLIVNDGADDSLPAKVTIHANEPNKTPIANGGQDQAVYVNDTVLLSAANSNDLDGDKLTYSWTLISQPNNSNLTLSNAGAVSTTFIPEQEGVYSFELIVRDGKTSSAPDTIVVTATFANRKPTAMAGQDQHANIGKVVMLDGSASNDIDGNALTYRWKIMSPENTTAKLSDASAVMPTFTIQEHGVYVVQLIVNDGKLDSDADTISFEVGNVKPIANAGADIKGNLNNPLQLSGALSSDLDGDALAYQWRIAQAPLSSNAQIINNTALTPSFTPDQLGEYTLELIVNDGLVNSDPDTMVIDTRNTRPIANAGADQSVSIDELALLDGNGSSDADGNSLKYSWNILSKPTGSSVALLSSSESISKLKIDKSGSYVIQLVVNDGVESSAADTVVLTTKNVRPIAEAGNTRTVVVGSKVTLDGSASVDSDGDKLNYRWSLINKPSNSTANLLNDSVVNPTFTADKQGVYIAQLIVNDGLLDSASDTITINVEQPVCNLDSTTTRTLPVTIRDFKLPHPDFETFDSNVTDSGIVAENLDANGLPVYARQTGKTATTTGAKNFNQWYRDVSGVNINIPKTLEMTRKPGTTVWSYVNSSFFPIDGMGFGNMPKPAPDHNYHFTLEAHLAFDYVGGEEFAFSGDDDLWVFINGKLAIDIGGVHPTLSSSVKLDSIAARLGIQKGKSYRFDLFFAERRTVESNFKFQTNINLECTPNAQ